MDPTYPSDALIAKGKASHDIDGLITRIIVNENHFPCDTDKCRPKPFNQRDNVFSFIESWYDDGEFNAILPWDFALCERQSLRPYAEGSHMR
jgi:hypothetical protein